MLRLDSPGGEPARAIRRILYVDPYLGPLAGHWATLARSFIRGGRALGLDVRLVGNVQQERGILEELEVAPAFSLPPYPPYGLDPHDPPRALAAFHSQIDTYAAEIEALARTELRQEDLVVFPTIYPSILGGIVRWAERAPERRAQRVALVTHFSDNVDVYSRGARGGARGRDYYVHFYRRVFPPATARRRFPNWRFFSLSPGLADLYAILLGEDVGTLPMPTAALAGTPSPRPRRDVRTAVTIAIVGHTSLLRGGLLVKEIVDLTMSRHPEARFNLHISTNPETRRLDEEFAAESERITIRRGFLPEAELQAFIDDADIVVLPYRPAPYRMMASASFIQVVASGKVVVIPAGTHMHRDLVAHGGGYAVFGEHTPDAIVAALSAAIERLGELRAAAEAAASGHRARNSEQACVAQMLAAFGQASGSNRTMREPERSKRNGIWR